MGTTVEHIIEYSGIMMTVQGRYFPAEEQTWDHPGSAEAFEALKVCVRDVDIIGLIADQVMEIEDTVLNQCYS